MGFDQNVSGDGVVEDLTNYGGRIAISVYLILVCIVGLIGNTMVITAVVNFPRMRTITNLFIGSLAVSDLAICLTIPWLVVGLLSTTGWPMPAWVCKVVAFAWTMTFGSSVWHLVIIGLNRMVIITMSPYVYNKIYQPRYIAVMIAGTWLLPVIVLAIPFACGAIVLGFDTGTNLCSDLEDELAEGAPNVMAIVSGFFLSCLPLCIVIICYIRIFLYVKLHLSRRRKSLRDGAVTVHECTISMESVGEANVMGISKITKNRRKSSSASRRNDQLEVRITQNCFFVVLGFLICIVPYGVCVLAQLGFKGVPLAVAFLVSATCINPVIYGTKHPHFKTAMWRLIQFRFTRDSNVGATSTHGQPTNSKEGVVDRSGTSSQDVI